MQADHQDRHRGDGGQVQRDSAGATQRLDHHVVDDLDDLLARGDAVQHLHLGGGIADLADEIFDDGEGDVRLQQRKANLTQRLGDVEFGQAAALAQPLEHPVQLARQCVEHIARSTTTSAPLRDYRGAAVPPWGRDAHASGSGV